MQKRNLMLLPDELIPESVSSVQAAFIRLWYTACIGISILVLLSAGSVMIGFLGAALIVAAWIPVFSIQGSAGLLFWREATQTEKQLLLASLVLWCVGLAVTVTGNYLLVGLSWGTSFFFFFVEEKMKLRRKQEIVGH